MTTEEFRGNLREYLTISSIVGLGFLFWNWRYGLGWIMGNGLFYLNLFLRNWFYTTILHYRLTNAMLFILYSIAQLLLISVPIIGALTTHWFNVFTLLLGFLFYKFYFVYLKTLKKGRNG